MNQNILCRLCGEKCSTQYYSLFQSDLTNMITALASVKISDDELSNNVCFKCCQDLRTAYFIQQKICQNEKIYQDNLLAEYLNENHDELMKLVHQNDNKDINCDQLSELIDKLPNIVKISKIVKYTCTQCSEVFDSASLVLKHLQEHVSMVHNNNDQPGTESDILCECCGTVFTDFLDYVGHKIAKYECKICVISFGTEAELKEHIIQKHTKNKPFVCDVCYQEFNMLYRYKLHKDKHERRYAYVCKICNIEFNHSVSLDCHRETKHCGRSTPLHDEDAETEISLV